MTEMYENFGNAGLAGQNLGLPRATLDSYKILFLHMVLIEGLFSGLVAGKMGEGKAKAGLKHSTIMVFVGWIAFKLTIELQIIVLPIG
jgi:flagellar protein FlaJ